MSDAGSIHTAHDKHKISTHPQPSCSAFLRQPFQHRHIVTSSRGASNIHNIETCIHRPTLLPEPPTDCCKFHFEALYSNPLAAREEVAPRRPMCCDIFCANIFLIGSELQTSPHLRLNNHSPPTYVDDSKSSDLFQRQSTTYEWEQSIESGPLNRPVRLLSYIMSTIAQ